MLVKSLSWVGRQGRCHWSRSKSITRCVTKVVMRYFIWVKHKALSKEITTDLYRPSLSYWTVRDRRSSAVLTWLSEWNNMQPLLHCCRRPQLRSCQCYPSPLVRNTNMASSASLIPQKRKGVTDNERAVLRKRNREYPSSQAESIGLNDVNITRLGGVLLI